MNRLEQIEQRLKEIREEVNNDGADIDALTTEANNLIAERKQLLEQQKQRRGLLDRIAGIGGGEPIAPPTAPQSSFGVESAEYRIAWLRNLQGRASEQERAAVVANDAIPTHTMNKIIGMFSEYPILNAIDMTYIPGNVTYVVEGVNNDAQWVPMESAATDAEDTTTTVTLTAYKLIKTIEITADVSAMAIDAFESWLVAALNDKLAAAAAKAVISGTGSGQATGILANEAVAVTSTYSAELTWAGLMEMIAKLPTKYARNASLCIGRSVFYSTILGMQDDTGNRVVVADAQAPGRFNVMGYPVIVDDNAGDSIMFGDFKQYKFNFAQTPQVSTDKSVGFRTGSTVYRVMALADGKLADKNAIVVFTKAAG